MIAREVIKQSANGLRESGADGPSSIAHSQKVKKDVATIFAYRTEVVRRLFAWDECRALTNWTGRSPVTTRAHPEN